MGTTAGVNAKGFDSLGLNKQLLQAVADLGFKMPTAIQSRAAPQILAGHDVIGIAPTGTGKTLAYGLPLLMKIKFAKGSAPRALILGPTKELVIQLQEHLQGAAKYTDLRIASIYGGIGPSKQIERLSEGVDILVATPGRFLDLYRRQAIDTRSIGMLLLDEADKLMDMGFKPQIDAILEVVPVKRQNLMFSATMPGDVEVLAGEFLDFPQRIEVAPQSTAASTIAQCCYFLPNLKTKTYFLASLFEDPHFSRVLVFLKTKKRADALFKFIERKFEKSSRVIHANKGQNSRLNSIRSFEQGKIRFLITTDVTSRGIDISEVTHVVNFDVPTVYEDYVHRIGRTGRAFRAGTSITFVDEAEVYHLRKIEELIREKIREKTLPGDVVMYDTPFAEKQEMARAIDHQRRLEDPDFKGAFHEKKKIYTKKGRRVKRDLGRTAKPRR